MVGASNPFCWCLALRPEKANEIEEKAERCLASGSFFFLGGGFKYLLFSPLLGEMIQFD